MKIPMFSNSDGKKDAMLTFAVASFFIVCLKVLFGGMSVTIHDHPFSIGTIDASVIAAMLTPTLGAYVARRHTDSKISPSPEAEEEAKPSEKVD